MRVILFGVLFYLIFSNLHARIDESYSECVTRYGKPINVVNCSNYLQIATFCKNCYIVGVYFLRDKCLNGYGEWYARGIEYSKTNSTLTYKEAEDLLWLYAPSGVHGQRKWYRSEKSYNTWYLSNTSRSKRKSKWDEFVVGYLRKGKLSCFKESLLSHINAINSSIQFAEQSGL